METKKAISKVKNTAKNVGKSVANNPTNTLYIIGGVAAVYLGYKAIQKISDLFSDDNVQNNNVDVTLQVNSNGLSITPEVATQYASQLLQAINHKDWIGLSDTDEDTIEAVFSNINSEDFKLIYNIFGNKPYDSTNGNIPEDGFWGGIQDGLFASPVDLVTILKHELDSYFDSTVYNKLKPIIQGAGFTF